VFVTQNGSPLDPSNTRRLVSVLAAKAGVEGRVTPYDVRHTATSVLSAAQVPPELLADLLGHDDTRMVFRHFRHPVTPTIDVAADHMEQALDW
jgi:integrase